MTQWRQGNCNVTIIEWSVSNYVTFSPTKSSHVTVTVINNITFLECPLHLYNWRQRGQGLDCKYSYTIGRVIWRNLYSVHGCMQYWPNCREGQSMIIEYFPSLIPRLVSCIFTSPSLTAWGLLSNTAMIVRDYLYQAPPLNLSRGSISHIAWYALCKFNRSHSHFIVPPIQSIWVPPTDLRNYLVADLLFACNEL